MRNGLGALLDVLIAVFAALLTFATLWSEFAAVCRDWGSDRILAALLIICFDLLLLEDGSLLELFRFL